MTAAAVRLMEIDRYRPEDERQVQALYRRVFGDDAAAANRLRWQWQYAQNPSAPPGGPPIWLAREGQTVIGQYATMPVTLAVRGREIDASWGMDVMVAPERRRRGLGDQLVRIWDRQVGASLGLGLSGSARGLFERLRWPGRYTVHALTKPLSRRALRMPTWPVAVNRFVSYVSLPFIRLVARQRPLAGEVRSIRRFDDRFNDFWKRVRGDLGLGVRRDAPYLNWRYVQPPHVRYNVAVLERAGQVAGYVVYRHASEPRGRVTLLVDFLTDPDDEAGLMTLLRWVDREARAADSDKIRAFVMHQGFRRLLRKSGYFRIRTAIDFVAKINAIEVPAGYYDNPADWHLTLGDSDQDH
jgi:GNAT superfamily N-acetyltransferase